MGNVELSGVAIGFGNGFTFRSIGRDKDSVRSVPVAKEKSSGIRTAFGFAMQIAKRVLVAIVRTTGFVINAVIWLAMHGFTMIKVVGVTILVVVAIATACGKSSSASRPKSRHKTTVRAPKSSAKVEARVRPSSEGAINLVVS
jgi:hypothetical protein